MTTSLVRNIPCLLLGMTFLAGCSSGHKLMPTPNIYLQESEYPADRVPLHLQANKVDLLYFTDRAPDHNDLNELSYGSKRSASMAFGSTVVEIGNDLPWADLVKVSESEQRDSSSQLSVISRTEQGRFPETPYPFSIVDGMWINDAEVEAEHDRIAAEFKKELNRRLMMSDDKTVLVFIHGFNNTFDFAASSLAEVWHFLGRQGVPILYTWPAGSGGLFGYFTDRE
ncbi:MAG: alpha/beta hydrolase, partial [Methyloprofundus sp.]|nr:alpha/beta hydrolase [Methyloprofundus sp.]